MTKHPISRLLEVEYSKILLLGTCEYDLIWKQGLGRCDQVKKGHWYEPYSNRTGFLKEMDWRQIRTHWEHPV